MTVEGEEVWNTALVLANAILDALHRQNLLKRGGIEAIPRVRAIPELGGHFVIRAFLLRLSFETVEESHGVSLF